MRDEELWAFQSLEELCHGSCDIPAARWGEGIQCFWSRVMPQDHCEESSSTSWSLFPDFFPDKPCPLMAPRHWGISQYWAARNLGCCCGVPISHSAGTCSVSSSVMGKGLDPSAPFPLHRNHHPNHFAALNRTAMENKS